MSIYKHFSEFLKRTIIWDKVELSTITNQELSSLTNYFKCEQSSELHPKSWTKKQLLEVQFFYD